MGPIALGPVAIAATALVVVFGLYLAQPEPTSDPTWGARPSNGSLATSVGPVVLQPSASVLPIGQTVAGTQLLPSGAQVEVERGQVIVAFATPDQTRLRLTSGRVKSTVPKLASTQRYEVETALALVSVRGTQFTVETTDDGATLVSVTEGTVVVEVLAMTEQWRVAVVLGRGQSRRIDACGPSPEAAIALERPWTCQVEGQAALAARADAAGQSNAALVSRIRQGRLLSEHAPIEAVEHWHTLNASASLSTFAEEVLFREGEALSRLGRKAEARQMGQRFRATFPESARRIETEGF